MRTDVFDFVKVPIHWMYGLSIIVAIFFSGRQLRALVHWLFHTVHGHLGEGLEVLWYAGQSIASVSLSSFEVLLGLLQGQ